MKKICDTVVSRFNHKLFCLKLILCACLGALVTCADYDGSQARKQAHKENKCMIALAAGAAVTRPTNPTMADGIANVMLTCHEVTS